MSEDNSESGLNIVAPIKQVPEMDNVEFDKEEGRVDRGSAGTETNPFDLNALEAAITIKEDIEATITAVSMGPPQAKSALRDAMARGADKGILLTDKKFAGSDTLATSYTIAKAIEKIGNFDFIFCGEKTVDGDTGQVGPEIAEHLGIPHVCYCNEIKEYGKEKILVKSEIGRKEYSIEIKSPGLITVTKDINEPRYLSRRMKRRAKSLDVEVWDIDDLKDTGDMEKFGFKGSSTLVNKITVPTQETRKREIFKGDPEESVEKLVGELEDYL